MNHTGLYCRGLPINPKMVNKLIPPIFVFVLSCLFLNVFFFLISGVAVKFAPPLNHRGPPLAEKSLDCWFRQFKSWVLMHWMQRKTLSSLQGTISEKNQEKQPKMGIFGPFDHSRPFGQFFMIFSESILSECCGFLHCIKRIKTLLLSYENQQSNNFVI